MSVPLILKFSPNINIAKSPKSPNTFYLEFSFMCLQRLFNIDISVTKLKMKKGRKDHFSPLEYQSVADRARLEVRNPSFSLIINHAPIV